MKHAGLGMLVLGLLAGCNGEPPIDRVGVNIIDKAVLEGSWYMGRTVIDVDYEAGAASYVGTYPGDAASDFGDTSFYTLPRIRWVIDEDFLYAYRDYEFFQGIDGVPVAPGEHLGEPVAAFAIESHLDIRRQYNTVTGEEFNVIEENTTDRRWYERDFMRVDWSMNHLPGYYGQIRNLYETLGIFTREPVDLFVQTESDFPDSWRPQFHYMTCRSLDDESAECDPRDRDFAEDYEFGEIYSMSFVNQEIIAPGSVPDPFTGRMVPWCTSVYGDSPQCTALTAFTRTGFLKVSETREYVAENWNDTRFDRHGYFRLEQPTYDRSTSPDDPFYGGTDFLNYNINRHNIWMEWTDGAGNLLPFAERRVRPIVWYMTSEMPGHLVKPSLDLTSSWNELFMSTVRNLRGEAPAVYPRVQCQSENPDDYCFCEESPVDGTILNPTCAGRYDPYQTPAEAEAAGVMNPYQCWIEVPEGAEPNMADIEVADSLRDEDFYGWFGAEFVGDECVNVLRMNTCNRASVAANGGTVEGLECEERGDMRFKFVSYVDQPGTRFLGVATLRSDPVTGEILVGDANMGGPALDGYRTSSLQQFDLVNGNITDEELYTGEDIRSYLASTNNIDLPAPPRIDFNVAPVAVNATAAAQVAGARGVMERAMTRAAQLEGPEGRRNIFSDRLMDLAGTDLERRLTDNIDTFALAGLPALPGPEARPTEAILDQASPFRITAQDRLNRLERSEQRIGYANFMMPNAYVDDSVTHFVTNHKDWPRARLEFTLNRLLYFETQLHELGHCLGLRHQFTASADRANYYDDYYIIDERFPLPDPATFDVDGTPGFSVDEQVAYEDAYEAARRNRERAGIDRWMNTSVMEYTANWYQRTIGSPGRYDVAAVQYGYGDMVEVYDLNGREDGAPDVPLDEINPINTPRAWARYYEGGEVCSVDADCPFSSEGSAAGTLTDVNRASGLTQVCNPNPRGADIGGVCSNFDVDAATRLTPESGFVQVDYQFCTDERAAGLGTSPGTIGICHRFDEGDSYREIVRNVVESYDRMYLWTNFRRYRSSFDLGGYVFDRVIGRRLILLQNIYQNLVFRYATDPEFREQDGPFGFYDQFLATADVLNFYARILGQPDVGTYSYDDAWERYERVSPNPDLPGAQLTMPIGMGRYFGSTYQNGLTGIYRIERIGTFYDKQFVMDLMTRRGVQTAYTRDVPFYTNFYDLFPLEMQELFSGMIRDEPRAYMPRVTCGAGTFPTCEDPRVVFMDFYRGNCSEGSTACRETAEEVYAGDNYEILNSGGSLLLQIYAALFGLGEFPVFFDTTFAQQLFVCREGSGDCPEPAGGSVEGTDFVRYTSERYGQSFLAYRVDDPTTSAVDESIGFDMVLEARDLSFILEMLQRFRGDDGGTPFAIANLTPAERAELARLEYTLPDDAATLDSEETRIFRRVLQLEGFFNQLIQLERQVGVASYLGFRQ